MAASGGRQKGVCKPPRPYPVVQPPHVSPSAQLPASCNCSCFCNHFGRRPYSATCCVIRTAPSSPMPARSRPPMPPTSGQRTARKTVRRGKMLPACCLLACLLLHPHVISSSVSVLVWGGCGTSWHQLPNSGHLLTSVSHAWQNRPARCSCQAGEACSAPTRYASQGLNVCH